MTDIRQLLAGPEIEANISLLLQNTNILAIVGSLLALDDSQDKLVRYLKLEAAWILTNISYGKGSDIQEIFNEEYSIIKSLNDILRGFDLQMIDQVFFFIRNVLHTDKNTFKVIVREMKVGEVVIDKYKKLLDAHMQL